MSDPSTNQVTVESPPAPNGDTGAVASPPASSGGKVADPAASNGRPAEATAADDLGDAFRLGWSLAELIGRVGVAQCDLEIAAAKVKSDGDQPEAWPGAAAAARLADELSGATGAMWLISMWRVNLDRVARLHDRLLHDSTTANTRYDPGERLPSYLFPDPPDYADIGIGGRAAGSAGPPDAFRLWETTRRALNALALLYLDPALSLLPEILTEQQRRLIEAVIAASPPGSTGDAPPADESDEARLARQRRATITKVTAQALLLLHAWEAYLRETFFAANLSARDETKLIAFEAGRTMAALSWDVTVQSKVVASGSPDAVTAQKLGDVWATAFSDRSVSRLQHQLAVLGSTLDGATPTSDDATPGPREAAIAAVRRSLDYWQRSVTALRGSTPPPPGGVPPDESISTPGLEVDVTPDLWEQLRVTLIEQVDLWQSLVLGQESLAAYQAPAVLQRIMQDVAVEFEAVAARQGIIETAAAVERQTDEIVAQARREVERVGAAAMGLLRQVSWGVWIGLGLLGLAAAAVVVFLVLRGGADGSSMFATGALASLGGGALAGWIGRKSAEAQPAAIAAPAAAAGSASPAAPAGAVASVPAAAAAQASPASTGLAGLGSRLAVLGSSAVQKGVDAFDRGFEKVREDLADLSHSVAVSYPLIEYFALDDRFHTIHNSIQFVDQIVWNDTDRREEVRRIAFAAFGSLGLFAIAAATAAPKDAPVAVAPAIAVPEPSEPGKGGIGGWFARTFGGRAAGPLTPKAPP